MKFCKRCLYSEAHPLGIVIDSEGICSGCRIHEEKDKLDWNYRWNKLKKIVSEYRCKSGNNYDCIVPVTGGNDSYYIVWLVKEKLKLNPLLVNYNKFYNTPLGIRNLANLRIHFNCDIIYQNVNPLSVKKITRETLRRFGSIYWHILAGHSVFPVQTSVRFKIPLIIWGAHQGLEQVGMFSHEHEVEMTRRYREDHDLFMACPTRLKTPFNTINDNDLWNYLYPDDFDLNIVGTRGIYLGNFVRWDPKAQHELMIKNCSYKTSQFSRTFDCYDYVDCYNYMNLHDLLKLYKHGYSKVTDHATREIRHKRITKENALKLVKKYEQKPVLFLSKFCNWLGINEKSLQFILNQHRNKKYWIQKTPNSWVFNGWSNLNRNSKSLNDSKNELEKSFEINDSIDNQKTSNYITIGKGYP
ncbi:MAG: LPS biosynthesis protein [Candidatus Endolissoclinum sp. TMED37]|nr:MAG: LPS biosynthesis protein [Candidatus Endolissoclinum sp. TMED37]|tara:strand:+ start:3210 stop:4448 length:1239 start_codon:yes stop_codon:yes gene_type:complete